MRQTIRSKRGALLLARSSHSAFIAVAIFCNSVQSPEQDAKRKALNEFIRAPGVFDGVADFDSATRDPATGGLKPEFVHNTTTGGDGDKLHPNRLGYIAMGMAVDLNTMRPLAAKAAP